jgi:hypothetical protein
MSSRARVVTSTPKCCPLIWKSKSGVFLADLQAGTGLEEFPGHDQLGAGFQKLGECLVPSGPPPVLAELFPLAHQSGEVVLVEASEERAYVFQQLRGYPRLGQHVVLAGPSQTAAPGRGASPDQRPRISRRRPGLPLSGVHPCVPALSAVRATDGHGHPG